MGPAPHAHGGRDRSASALESSDTPRYAGQPWEDAMRDALAAAASARASGDVPVGALVLGPGGPSGPVLGRGHNVRERDHDPLGHAEVVALRAASRATGSWRLAGCTLVVTLEPCTMCAGAAVAARVDRIVYGATDPKAGAVTSLWDVVRDPRLNHRPEVIGGVLAADCEAGLAEFFDAARAASGQP